MNKFRQDINALRAIAVLVVIAYHFNVFGMQGGFVGVDIFFVISGYLMTAIVVGALLQQRFSLSQFYLARARRIVPALWVLCVLLLTAGAVLVPMPSDYVVLSKHVYKAMLFVSNNTFYQESGYFAASANEKWVLHTWSLSLEWQFYLLYPLLLWGMWKTKPQLWAMNTMLVVLWVASFVSNVILSQTHPEYAFFMLPTRAWELLSGGLLYSLPLNKTLPTRLTKPLQWLGLLLLVLVVFGFNSHLRWPGYWALLPVVATVLVMLGNHTNRLFEYKWVQWCGSTSYSLYLWHWPIWVGLHYFYLSDSGVAVALGLVATLVMGAISYYWIEKPWRLRLGLFSNKATVVVLLAMVGVVFVEARVIRQFDGFPDRLNGYLAKVAAERADKNPREEACQGNTDKLAAECRYGGPKLGLIVMGDSHAQAIVRAAEQALPSKKEHVLDWTMAACPALMGIKSTDNRSRCNQQMRLFFEKQKQLPKNVPILLVSRWSNYIEGPSEADQIAQRTTPQYHFGLRPYATRTAAFYQEMDAGMVKTACELAKYRPVYMLKPIPEMPVDVPSYMVKRSWIGQSDAVNLPVATYHLRHAKVLHSLQQAEQKCGIKLLDPVPSLCSGQYCQSRDGQGIPLYYDDDHLSLHGAQRLLPVFQTMFH